MYKVTAVVQSGARRMGPTITVAGSKGREEGILAGAVVKRTWRDRKVRPITEDEERYEILRVTCRNSGPNLKMNGKNSLQLNKRERKTTYNSYDSI